MKKSPSILCLRPLLINLSSVKTIHFLHNKAPADWRRRFKALCKDLTCRCLPSRPLRYLRFHLLTRPLCISARLSDIACLSWAIAGVFFKNSCLILRPAVASEWIILPIFASPAPYFVFERSRYFLPVLLWTAICCHIEQTISSLFHRGHRFHSLECTPFRDSRYTLPSVIICFICSGEHLCRNFW